MLQTMTIEQKKAFMLLKYIIFSYHGLNEDEHKILEETAEKLDASEELRWVEAFINEDPVTSFERARKYFLKTIGTYDNETRLTYLNTVWESTNLKGYISEMEALTLLRLAKDWGVQKDLLNLVRK